jgi:hypothetical protein
MSEEIKPYTKQSLFDAMIGHLRKQGCRSVSPWGACMYRSPDGLKCAFGGVIPDRLYGAWMEGMNSGNVLRAEDCPEELKTMFPVEVRPLAYAVQSVHDNHDNYEPSQWEAHFKRVANEFGVRYSSP